MMLCSYILHSSESMNEATVGYKQGMIHIGANIYVLLPYTISILQY